MGSAVTKDRAIRESNAALVLAALLAGLAIALPAHADVMEINGAQQTWIAGGPVKPAAPAAPLPSEAAPASLGAATDDSRVLTRIDTAAGPAQWRSRVAELAAKYDISPSLLEAVVWQESRWNTGAVSPVGARGLAQLMPGTARQMGVNPDDPHANLEGGARYLRMQLDTFGGNVEKALAAYNAGPGRVHKAGGIPAIRETQEYVASILARLSAPVRK
jgi:soluble lytic murein transglycosylase-like protein